jgi:hypothetical protein
MTKTIDKKHYEKPSMKVYGLKQQPHLLAGSLPTNDGPWPGGVPL